MLAVLKLKLTRPSKHPLNIPFTKDGETIKEVVDTSQDGDPLDCLIAIKLHMLQLQDENDQFKDGKWKKLCTTMHIELSLAHARMNGTRKPVWSEILKQALQVINTRKSSNSSKSLTRNIWQKIHSRPRRKQYTMANRPIMDTTIAKLSRDYS